MQTNNLSFTIVSISPLQDNLYHIIQVSISNGEHMETKKCHITAEQYNQSSFQKGLISQEQFICIERYSKVCYAIESGLRILLYAPNTKKALERKLLMRGHTKEDIHKAVLFLDAHGLFHEKADLEACIQLDLNKLWGKARIIRHLHEKGYNDEDIQQAKYVFEEVNFVDNCKRLIQIKYKTLQREDKNETKKVIAALLRYGYAYSEIKSALKI